MGGSEAKKKMGIYLILFGFLISVVLFILGVFTMGVLWIFQPLGWIVIGVGIYFWWVNRDSDGGSSYSDSDEDKKKMGIYLIIGGTTFIVVFFFLGFLTFGIAWLLGPIGFIILTVGVYLWWVNRDHISDGGSSYSDSSEDKKKMGMYLIIGGTLFIVVFFLLGFLTFGLTWCLIPFGFIILAVGIYFWGVYQEEDGGSSYSDSSEDKKKMGIYLIIGGNFVIIISVFLAPLTFGLSLIVLFFAVIVLAVGVYLWWVNREEYGGSSVNCSCISGESEDLKKIGIYLIIFGVVASVIGGIIGILTFGLGWILVPIGWVMTGAGVYLWWVNRDDYYEREEKKRVAERKKKRAEKKKEEAIKKRREKQEMELEKRLEKEAKKHRKILEKKKKEEEERKHQEKLKEKERIFRQKLEEEEKMELENVVIPHVPSEVPDNLVPDPQSNPDFGTWNTQLGDAQREQATAPTMTTVDQRQFMKPIDVNDGISAPTMTDTIQAKVFGDGSTGLLGTMARAGMIHGQISEVSTKRTEEMLQHKYIISSSDVFFKPNSLVGKGSFGSVHLAEIDFEEYAVKLLNIKKMNQSTLEEFIREASIMTKLRHPNLVPLYFVVLEIGKYCLVMDFYRLGSLHKVLHDPEQELPWSQRYQLAMDIGRGIHHLHKNNVLHRDLKSLNVLIEEKNRILRGRLCDFGMATVKKESKEEGNKENSGPIGTIQWMAVELIENEEYTAKSDMYSFGIILWELASRKTPYENYSSMEMILESVKNGYREEMPNEAPEIWKDLYVKLVEKDPSKRPGIVDVLQRLKGGIESLKE